MEWGRPPERPAGAHLLFRTVAMSACGHAVRLRASRSRRGRTSIVVINAAVIRPIVRTACDRRSGRLRTARSWCLAVQCGKLTSITWNGMRTSALMRPAFPAFTIVRGQPVPEYERLVRPGLTAVAKVIRECLTTGHLHTLLPLRASSVCRVVAACRPSRRPHARPARSP